MHPILEEILRAKLPIRPAVLSRWQRAIRDEIAPAIDRAEAQRKTKSEAA